MSCDHPELARELPALFEGTLSPARALAVRVHCQGCPSCRRDYGSLHLRATLLPSEVDSATRLGRASGVLPTPAKIRWPLWVAPLAIAAGLVLALWPTPPLGDESAWVARGTVASSAALFPLADTAHRGPELVQGAHLPSDELLAVEILNPRPRAYVLAFALDSQGEVFWYYPRWTNPAEDPLGFGWEGPSGRKVLPRAVAHPLAPGQARLVVLLTDLPLTVKAVERALSRLGPKAGVTWLASLPATELARALEVQVSP